jgi:hypothetical protein
MTFSAYWCFCWAAWAFPKFFARCHKSPSSQLQFSSQSPDCPITKYTEQNQLRADYDYASFQNLRVGHHPPPQNLPFATVLATPLSADNDDDLPPTHKILETVAHRSVKVAGARRPTTSAKGKEKLAAQPAPPQSGNGKRRATSPLRHADGKKQRGRATGAHNYSSEDLDALFDILEECLPLGGHAWNSAGDDFNTWAQENGRPSRTAKSLELKFKQVRTYIYFFGKC